MKKFFTTNALSCLTLILTLVVTQQAFAVDKTYIGTSADFWDQANKWSPSGVPADGDNVIIPDNATLTIRTTVSRTGTTTIGVGGSIGLSNGGTLNNAGAMTINGIMDISIISGTGTINNNSGGTITITGDGSFSSGYLLVQAVSPGVAVFNNNSGATITMNSGAYIQIALDNTVTNAGTINNNNSLLLINGTLNNTGTINSTSGTISGAGGVVSGSLYTNPASATINAEYSITNEYSCLTFSNGLTNNGIVLFNVDGNTACTNRDRITVTGAMTFGGTFAAVGTVASGSYTLMTYGSRTGTFTNSTAPLGNGNYLNISSGNYGATSLTATVSGIPLKVEFINFDGHTEGGKNYLNWATGNEESSHIFDIERSENGTTFYSIGTVKAQGKAATYKFTDESPRPRNNYYRLKQIDADGSYIYSKSIAIETGKGKKTLMVFPTLVTDNTLMIDTEESHYAIYNIVGQQVQSGKTTQRLDVSALAKGTYILKVGTEQAKFVKQ